MQKKDYKVGNKTVNKQKRQRKKRGREKVWNRFAKKDQILAFVHALKTNKLFNFVRLVKKYAFFSRKTHF